MGNNVTGEYVSACCGASITQGQRLNGQMFDQCSKCNSACDVEFRADHQPEHSALSEAAAPSGEEGPDRAMGLTEAQTSRSASNAQIEVSGESDNLDALAQEFKDVGDKVAEHAPDCDCADCKRFCELSDAIISDPRQFERYRALRESPIGGQCATCANPAEILLFTDPPIKKCFNCAILTAMKLDCALCGNHPVEAIVRAMADGDKQGTIGVCVSCLIKNHSAMRN